MHRRDLDFIASTIKGMPSHSDTLRAHRDAAAAQFARALAKASPSFDAARFLKACGVSLNPAEVVA